MDAVHTGSISVWAVFFMRKLTRNVGVCLSIVVCLWFFSIWSDKGHLRENLIRFHVVANSDSEWDQNVKLQVRDAVVESLQKEMASLGDMNAAKAYLLENLPKIKRIANDTLRSVGFEGDAVVTLCKETFEQREYDTFSLPAGVYESLRIVIGNGEGHNWWCVVFPSLCLPATTKGFTDVAVGSGFSETLSDTLSGDESCSNLWYRYSS